MNKFQKLYFLLLAVMLVSFVNAKDDCDTVSHNGRTPGMQLIFELDAKINEIKYGQPGIEAFINSAVVDAYFLHGMYSAFGPFVSDKIEADVQNITQKMQKELDLASSKLKDLISGPEFFSEQDNDGRTVLQYCTTKESYQLLRQHGLKYKVNSAVRIYGRHYAPVLIDYLIFGAIAAYCTSGFTATQFNCDRLFNNLRIH